MKTTCAIWDICQDVKHMKGTIWSSEKHAAHLVHRTECLSDLKNIPLWIQEHYLGYQVTDVRQDSTGCQVNLPVGGFDQLLVQTQVLHRTLSSHTQLIQITGQQAQQETFNDESGLQLDTKSSSLHLSSQNAFLVTSVFCLWGSYLVSRSRTCCLRLGIVVRASTMVQAACLAAWVAGVKRTYNKLLMRLLRTASREHFQNNFIVCASYLSQPVVVAQLEQAGEETFTFSWPHELLPLPHILLQQILPSQLSLPLRLGNHLLACVCWDQFKCERLTVMTFH